MTRKKARPPTTPSLLDPVEWVGGSRELPMPPGARGSRLAVALWMRDGIAFQSQPGPVSTAKRTLIETLERGIEREGRTPSVVRVATTDEAARVRAVLGAHVNVRVAPTPEIDALVESFVSQLNALAEAEDEDDGQLPHPFEELIMVAERDPALVARYFERAAALHRHEPWNLVPGDGDVFLIEAPSLPWKRRDVVIVGQNGESFGFMAFASIDSLARFREGVPGGDVGADFFALNYDPVDDMPPPVRRDLTRRRWRLSRPDAIPLLFSMTRHSDPTSLQPDVVAAAAVLCVALTAFFDEHARAMRQDPFTPRESSCEVDGAAVTVRYATLDERLAEEGHPPDLADALDLEREAAVLLSDWREDFARRFPSEVVAAREEIVTARRGHRATQQEQRDDELLATSLPGVWAAFFRPMSDGKTGLEALAADAMYEDLGAVAARSCFERARLLFGEVLDVDFDASTLTLRGLLDDERYTVEAPNPEQLQRYVRWMPVLGFVIPVEGGRWSFPSVFVGWEHGLGMPVEGFVARVREALALIGRPLGEVEGAALRDALLRELGVMHAVFQRGIDEVLAKGPPKRFLTNTDGECIEFQEVTVSLPLQVRAVAKALSSAEDFIRVGDKCWELVDRTRTTASPSGESMGALERKPPRWIVRGNSPGRVTRLLDRLEALFGVRPTQVSRQVTAPWETDKLIVRTKAEADETVQLSSGPVSASSPMVGASRREMVFAMIRRQLDEPNKSLGGVPRELARSPEGREAVERWLRTGESRGLPADEGESRMLDLDPLRRELGLPTVM